MKLDESSKVILGFTLSFRLHLRLSFRLSFSKKKAPARCRGLSLFSQRALLIARFARLLFKTLAGRNEGARAADHQ